MFEEEGIYEVIETHITDEYIHPETNTYIYDLMVQQQNRDVRQGKFFKSCVIRGIQEVPSSLAEELSWDEEVKLHKKEDTIKPVHEILKEMARARMESFVTSGAEPRSIYDEYDTEYGHRGILYFGLDKSNVVGYRLIYEDYDLIERTKRAIKKDDIDRINNIYGDKPEYVLIRKRGPVNVGLNSQQGELQGFKTWQDAMQYLNNLSSISDYLLVNTNNFCEVFECKRRIETIGGKLSKKQIQNLKNSGIEVLELYNSVVFGII